MADIQLAEDTDTGLLREIDEEIRQEHYEKLWSQYGKHVIAAAILLVASVAGYKGWQSYDLSQRTESGQQFAQAIASVSAGNLDEAQSAFSTLAEDGTTGYRTLAKFRVAAILAEKGETDNAANAYRSIATDSEVPAEYRDLAVVLAAINSLDTADPSSVVAALAPVTGDGNPWRHTAREISAVALISGGQTDEAIKILTPLSSDAAAPAGMRQRAQEQLAALGQP